MKSIEYVGTFYGMASHALIGWEDIAFPYEEGGLRVRDLLIVNKACVLRHIWYIIADRNILWVQWVKKRKINNKDFWALQIPANCSCTWRAILNGRRDA